MSTPRQLALTVLAAAALTIGAAQAQTLTTLHQFAGGADGAYPAAALLYFNGTLYGTTTYGGTGTCSPPSPPGCGTAFAVDATSGAESVLHSFTGKGGRGARHDGNGPVAGVIEHRAVLYGTTPAGGSAGGGTVFKLNPQTDGEALLHSFKGGSDGAAPDGELFYLDGALYGTTFEGGGTCNQPGGSQGCGTVFKLDLATRVETVLYSFQGGADDGALPFYGTLAYKDGFFYGTTREGGASNLGTVFEVDAATGAETVLHSFAGGKHDGASPYAGVVYLQGHLYGTTSSGGAFGKGTVFRVDPVTGGERVIYSFAGEQQPWDPQAGLIVQNGLLYGTTAQGGTHHLGTVFWLDPATGVLTVLHSFAGGKDGEAPGGLVYNQGTFYGTTSGGGTIENPNYGTVFKLTP